MARVLKPTPQEPYQTVEPAWKVALPTTLPCQIYPRVSTPEQMRNVSAEMQQDKTFAEQCGWADDGVHIIMDIRDLGVSGQLRMEERLAFRDMLRRIENGEIGAVVTCNVDRLFRNKWGDESGKFMEICHRYNVVIVTPDFVYDFRINWHIERFRRRCEEAWNYLEYHVYGRMLKAQEARARAGYWAGRSIPLGYVLDRRKTLDGRENPNYNRYIPYEPHAASIRWIFQMFKEHNGNVHALLREIEAKQCLFPDFPDDIEEAVRNQFVHVTKVPGGYTIASETGLRSLLVNVAYIGYWVYDGELIRTHNHEPIVDFDTFLFAYNFLSPTKLDGTPNEQVLERRGRYMKWHVPDRPTLLKNCLVSADPHYRVYNRMIRKKNGVNVYYGLLYKGKDKGWHAVKSLIPAAALDRVVLEQLILRMRTPQAEQDLHDFLTYEDATVKEASETLKSIDRDILATRALIERLENQASLGLLTDEGLARQANESYTAAKQELVRLEAKKSETTQIAQEDQERRTYKQLMQDVGDAWNEVVMPEELPRLIYLFIKAIVLEYLSPQFFSLIIQWRDPMWEQDKAICYRTNKASLDWTDAEKAILREHYPSASWQRLLELLPQRSGVAIKDQGTEVLQIQRSSKRWESVVPRTICLADWTLMQQYGVTVEQLSSGGVKIVSWSSRQADIQ